MTQTVLFMNWDPQKEGGRQSGGDHADGLLGPQPGSFPLLFLSGVYILQRGICEYLGPAFLNWGFSQ